MKDKKTLPRMDFNVDEFPGCCGIGVITYFKPEEPAWDWNYRIQTKPKLLYSTKEEQAEACYKEFTARTANRDGYEYYTQLFITLVSSYSPDSGKSGQHQYPELEAILLREGWTIHNVFINPNHGNEVTIYGKYFPERHYEKDENEDIYDDYYDDDDEE